ncbi:MAG: hypothetical protein K1X86_14170 [Ignavibacteria bacterium]|nr:hypothetical protein [Ignavibacteria bacterium]
MKEEITLKAGEKFNLVMQGRGALGLELSFENSDSSVIQLNRVDSDNLDRNPEAGSSVQIVFEVIALKKGKADLIFFESKPWDNNFQKIVKKQFSVIVD